MIKYPHAKTEKVIENLHGIPVSDPYRWMEDIDSEETRAWINAQNQLTQGYLTDLPDRDSLRQRMMELWDYEKFTPPTHHAGRYFYAYNSGLLNQDVLYWMEGLDDPQPKVLLDPNSLSSDGTIALTGAAISHNGKYLAYGLSEAGSDWQEWYVRQVDDGIDEPDHLRWVKFSSAAWDKNDLGFYYSRYDAPVDEDSFKKANYEQKLYYHRLGTPQEEDILIYARPDHKDWMFKGFETEDGAYLIVVITIGTQEEVAVFVKDLSLPDAPVKPLLPDFDAEYYFIDSQGPLFYFLTSESAPLRRLVGIDVNTPDKENWLELIPQSNETLQDVSLIAERFICTYLADAVSAVRLFDLKGNHLGQVDLPGMGTVSGFSGRKSDTLTFYAYTDITTPPMVYKFDPLTRQSACFRQPKLQFDPTRYTTERVFVTSKDGTQVPMFISHKKGLQKNGSLPTYLFGYGGFNIAIPVMFKVPILVWMEMGGVYAQVQLRGGGEYGERWHQAGMKENKQNVFDDFISAAEWLINEGYTKRESLAIAGRSNGGLLIGAVMTQRPDLFGVCMPTVGVMDMLRFHKFTIGWAWVSDYGSPDNPEEFKTLLNYSPYHNIKSGTHYPPTIITTGDHDDRVFPAHSYKFAAALQAAQASTAPILIRIDTKAGHGVGKPTQKLIQEFSDLWAFAWSHINQESG